MNRPGRSDARNRVSDSEQHAFERVDAVRVLQGVISTYLNPPSFKPGDLVQSRRHFVAWVGHETAEMAPMAVLATTENLAEMTDDSAHQGIRGIRIAVAMADCGLRLSWDEAWHFEPYTGPMPDAH